MAIVVTGRVVLLFALKREAASLTRMSFDGSVAFVGMRATATRQVFDSFPRPDLVISVGIAGGLRDGLHVGDVIVPSEVVSEYGRRWPCATFGEQSGRLLTVNQPLLGTDAKRRAGTAFAADVVDMEAAIIADVCASAGIPFAALKAVSDPVDVCLPAELSVIAPDGEPRYGKLLFSTLRRPRLIGQLLRLDRDCRRAARAACQRLDDVLATRPQKNQHFP